MLVVVSGYRKSELETLGSCTTLDILKVDSVDIVGDAHAIHLLDKSFDIIAVFMVLEHLSNPMLAFTEFRRVLKQNGFILLTTVQYWHGHGCPNDYYRFTKDGLLFLCHNTEPQVLEIWSMSGPFLVVFHAIELNLPGLLRKLFLLSCPVFNFLDDLFFKHQDQRLFPDSVGWSLIAQKQK